MLAMICITALLSNVLAVGLGALFNEDLTTANYTATFTPNVAPLFSNQSTPIFSQYANLQQFAYLAMANISSGTPLPPWSTSDYFFQPYTVDSGNESNSSSTYRVPTRGFSVNANCTAVPSSRFAVASPGKEGSSSEISCYNNRSDIVKLSKWGMQISWYIPSEQLGSFENSFSLYPADDSDSCSRTITFGWGRTSQLAELNGTIEASFAFCQPYFQTAMFDVRHDSEGNVLAYERTSEVSTHLDGDGQDERRNRVITQLNDALGFTGYWHNDTLTRDMMSYLLVISLNSRDFLDSEKPPPDPNDLIPAIEKVYRKLFIIILAANLQLFVPGDKALSVTGQKLTDETRIFVDQNAFIITITILGLNIIAVVVFYSRGIMFNLPRVPTTIGSILAFVSASHILLDDDKESSSSGDTKEKKTYSFGRYIGIDQKVHLGIDMDPHVALVDPASLKEKRSFIYRMVPSGLRKRKEIRPVSDSTWL
jgi:hypothetical protein